MGKDNRQLLSQKSQLSSSHIGMNRCITEANNRLSVVASSSKTDNGVSPVMEEASTELRCHKLLNQLISVTTTKSKEWTHQDMSRLEIFVGAEVLTLMKKGN